MWPTSSPILVAAVRTDRWESKASSTMSGSTWDVVYTTRATASSFDRVRDASINRFGPWRAIFNANVYGNAKENWSMTRSV